MLQANPTGLLALAKHCTLTNAWRNIMRITKFIAICALIVPASGCNTNATLQRLLDKVTERRIACVNAQVDLQRKFRDELWSDPDVKRILLNFCRQEAKPMTLADKALEDLRQDRLKHVRSDATTTMTTLKSLQESKALNGSSKEAAATTWMKRNCSQDTKGSLFALKFDDEQTDRWLSGRITALQRPITKDNAVSQAQIRIYRAMVDWHREHYSLANQCVADIEKILQ